MFTVYTVPDCLFCTKAKELLKNNEIDFEEVVLDRETFVQVLNEYSFADGRKLRTAPQITKNEEYNEEYIGGFTELSCYLVNNSDNFNTSEDF